MDDFVLFSGKKEYRGLVEQCIELEKACFEEKYRGNLDTYNYFFDTNPESFIFIFNKNRNVVAAFLLFVPLKSYAYNELKTGKYIDVEFIKKEDILPLKPGINNVYVYSVIVNPNFRGIGLADLLVNEFIELNEERKTNGVIIDNILGDIVNKNLLDEFEMYDFNVVGKSKHESWMIEKDEYKDIEVV